LHPHLPRALGLPAIVSNTPANDLLQPADFAGSVRKRWFAPIVVFRTKKPVLTAIE